MPTNQNKWLDRIKSGKYISVFDYNHPNKVLERSTTKCSGYAPGSHKQTTNK